MPGSTRLDLLEIYHGDLGDGDLVLKAGTIVDLGKKHPGLQDVPAEVTGPSVIHDLKVDFEVYIQTNKKQKTEEYTTKRWKLVEAIMMWGQFIVMRFKARNDPSILENNGFDPKKPVTKTANSKGPTPKPDPVVKHGRSTFLLVSLKRPRGGGTAEIRITTNPADEGSWADGGNHAHFRSIELPGMVPGTKYYIQARYHGINGTGPWSESVSIIAL